MTRKHPGRHPLIIDEKHARCIEWPPDDGHFQGLETRLNYTYICVECGFTLRNHWHLPRCPKHPEAEMKNLLCQYRVPKRGSREWKRMLDLLRLGASWRTLVEDGKKPWAMRTRVPR